MIPKKLIPILFGLIVSGIMSFVVSGISTYSTHGLLDMALWMGNWMKSWAVAFPTILVVAPIVRSALTKMAKP